MPTVPTYGQQRVGTAALPGARINPSAPGAAFQPAPGPDLSGVTRVVAQIAEQERQKADQIAVLDADNQLGQLQDAILYDPQQGVLNARGKNALDASAGVADHWQQGVSKIAAGLTTDTQRMAFERMVVARHHDVHETVERHVAGELRAYDDSTTKAGLARAANDALTHYTDPARVDHAIAKSRAILTDYAKRNGLPPEALAEQLAETTSQTHVGVIDRMLATGDDRAASEYYQAHHDAVTGADATRVERALEEGSTRGESQRQADAIVAKAGSRAEALELVRAIDDPTVRDATETRVNRYYSEQRTAAAEQHEALYLDATQRVDQHPGALARDAVPPGQWHQLTTAEQASLGRRATEPAANDDRAWLTFLSLDPSAIASLSRSEFETTYWSRFDGAHRSRAETLWLSTREAAANPTMRNPQHAATLTFRDRVNDAVRAAGIIPAGLPPSKVSHQQAEAARAFTDEADRRVRAFEDTELGGKRKASASEMQAIIDQMTITRVFVDTPDQDDVELPVAIVTDEERRTAYVPYDQIPIAERNDMEAHADAAGVHLSHDQMERAYAAMQFGDFTRARAILGVGAR